MTEHSQMPEISKGSATSQMREVEQALGVDAWRLTPATLAHKLSRGYWIPAAHLKYISALIAAKLSKGGARIIVSMPARHGKSELISVNTPIWLLDRDPMHELILTSYGADLATDFGQKARDLIVECSDPDSGLPRLNCTLLQGSQRVDRFLTTKRGGMRSVGIGGAVTGRGADTLLVDDYLKNAKDASSKTIRDDIWDWFVSTARTRLHPNGNIVILATRWNISDLIGTLLVEQPDVWDYIRLPALIETEQDLEDDPLGRKMGEALWPERYPVKELLQLKEELGQYFWAAMYQQKPITRSNSGVTRDQFNIVDEIPWKRLALTRAWDIAATPEGGDFIVGALVGADRETGYTYVCDIIRRQVGPAEVRGLIKYTAEEVDGTRIAIHIEQEPGSAGKILADQIIREDLQGFAATYARSTGEKFVRAQPFMAQVQAGNVRTKRAPWNKEFFDEFELFPDGVHDDQVDSTSSAYNELHKKHFGGVTWGRSRPTTLTSLPKVPSGILPVDVPTSPTEGSPTGNVITGVTFGRRPVRKAAL